MVLVWIKSETYNFVIIIIKELKKISILYQIKYYLKKKKHSSVGYTL